MRRIREALRLHLQAGLSYNEFGRALKISKSVVDCQRAYGQAQRSPCRSRLHDADCLRSHRQEQPSLKNCFIGSGLNGLRVLSQLTTVF